MSRAWDQTATFPTLSTITPPETFPALAPIETFAEERRIAARLMTVTPGPRRTSPMTGDGHKFCPGCRTVKRLTEFHRYRATPTGRASHCRDCVLAYQRSVAARKRADRETVTTDRADVARMTALLAEHERWEEVMLSAD